MNKDQKTEDILRELKELTHRITQQDKIIKSLQNENNKLKDDNIALRNENKILKETINKNSKNSSKPPSTDNKFKDKNSKKKMSKKKERGGQKGSTGNNLKKIDNPDKIEILQSDSCKNCDSNLENIKANHISTKQVFDLPKIKIEVTEFQQHTKICPHCDTLNKPNFPDNLKSYVQYGNNIKSFIAYLNTHQMIPYARISELLQDLISHKMSNGTIYNILASFYTKLEVYENTTKDLLLKSPVINVDETGTNINGKVHWTHTVSTSSLTYYMLHQKRGSQAIDDMDILPFFNGIAVHDHWRSYNKYNCSHSFCNAHHLRELVGVVQNEDATWAIHMHKLLTNMNNYIYKIKNNSKISPSRGKFRRYYELYDKICQGATQFYPPPNNQRKKGKQSKGKNLLDRFLKYKSETLRFFTNLLVPFTNNLAERDLRMIKVKEKISGCFVSFKGGEIFSRIRGYISTLKKNNMSVLEGLKNALEGKNYLPSC